MSHNLRAHIQEKINTEIGKQVFKPSFKNSGLKKEMHAYQAQSPIGYEAEKTIMKKSYQAKLKLSQAIYTRMGSNPRASTFHKGP